MLVLKISIFPSNVGHVGTETYTNPCITDTDDAALVPLSSTLFTVVLPSRLSYFVSKADTLEENQAVIAFKRDVNLSPVLVRR